MHRLSRLPLYHGEARRCAVSKTYKYSMQHSAVPVVVRKSLLYFDVLKLARVFPIQIVNSEKRRILERIGRFYEFTFGISQKSDVLIY